MPTLVCQTCHTTVRFEGVAGVCPKCASVVMLPKSDTERAARRQAATQPTVVSDPRPRAAVRIRDLTEAAGGDSDDDDVFEPTRPAPPPGGIDRGVVVTIIAVVFVVVAFVVFVMFSGHAAPSATADDEHGSGVGLPTKLNTDPDAGSHPAPQPVVAAVPDKPAVVAPVLPAWALLRPVHVPPDASLLTDEKVEASIRKASNFLLARLQSGAATASLTPGSGLSSGVQTLGVYSLEHAGQAISDPRLSSGSPQLNMLLDGVKRFPMDDQLTTYQRSLRASAFALLKRPNDRPALSADLQYLLASSIHGAFSYTRPPPKSDLNSLPWDNSNSQYGLLGVWAATDAGRTVPSSFWDDVENHWVSCQCTDGSWGYVGSSATGSLSMTCAAITSLSVVADQQVLTSGRGGRDARPRAAAAVRSGLRWLDTGDHSVQIGGLFAGYTLYGLERAALASGFKWFGQHDWYRELAATEIGQQQSDGSFGSEVTPEVATAFRLLFLSRGRQPLALNKLRFAGAWENRPRDAARLADFCSEELEQPFAWGVVDLSRNWWDWLDGPMLLVTTDTPPIVTDEQIARLRAYVDNGGLILLNNEWDTPEMSLFAVDLAARMYPGGHDIMRPVPADDLLYRTVVPMHKTPPLSGVNIGDRWTILYSPTDITRDWVARAGRQTNVDSQLGLNLFVYAAGKKRVPAEAAKPVRADADAGGVGDVARGAGDLRRKLESRAGRLAEIRAGVRDGYERRRRLAAPVGRHTRPARNAGGDPDRDRAGCVLRVGSRGPSALCRRRRRAAGRRVRRRSRFRLGDRQQAVARRVLRCGGDDRDAGRCGDGGRGAVRNSAHPAAPATRRRRAIRRCRRDSARRVLRR